MMKRLEKNRRRMITAVGMLAVAVVSVGCTQHVSLAENTNQPEVLIREQENNNQTEDTVIKSGGEENEFLGNLETDTTAQSIDGETEAMETESVTETTTEIETTEELETGTPVIAPKETQAVYDGTKEDAFFEKSVFVGDSVMMGFRNYILRQEAGFMGNPEFLVSGSYSLRMALNPVSSTTIHPIYQGEQRLIWDSMSMLGVDKVFIALGLNDIGMLSVEDTYENYQKVIQAIYEANPDISIYIISTTNIYNGSEVGNLNNENVRLLNQKMKNYCATSKEEFIDIADYLIDENGYLKDEYCSDNYVHQTPAAYNIWVQVLREFAGKHQKSNGQSEVGAASESETDPGSEADTNAERVEE